VIDIYICVWKGSLILNNNIYIYIYKIYFIIPYSVSQLISHENIQTVLPLQEYSLNNTENITVNTRLVAQQASWSNTHKNLAISQIVQG
jgi:hypothetical protein